MTIIRKRKSEVFFLLYEINSLSHSGIRGMRWGRRRYQNEDGSLTPMGRQHYGVGYGYADDAKQYLRFSHLSEMEKRGRKSSKAWYKKQRERDWYNLNEGIRNNQIDNGINLDEEVNSYRRRNDKFRDKWINNKVRSDMREYNRRSNADNIMYYRGQSLYRDKANLYDRYIQDSYNQSFAKAQRKWEKQQARRQFASSIASIAGQRLADYAVDAAVGAVSKQLNKAILDNKPSKGRYDYRQDVIDTKKSLKSHLKDTVSSGKRVMTEAKLAPSYKNLYNRLKASGRVSSFNQFLNEVYYPDLERRR